jgi:branched-chain amino acid transport system substrate-binding protein
MQGARGTKLRRYCLATSAICLITTVASVCVSTTIAQAATANKSTIVLGDIGDDSGPIGASFTDQKVAAQAWEDAINHEGGLNGHPVKVIFGNDDDSPATAVSLATTMVTNDHVVAMFGLHSLNSEANVVAYLQKQHIPAIGGSDDTADFTSSAVYSTITTSLTEYQDIDLTFKKLEPKDTKIAIVYCSEVPTCTQEGDTVKSYAKTAGLSVVYDASAPLSAPSYTAQVLAAKQAGAQEIAAIEDPPGALTLVENAAQQDWYPLVIGSATQYSSNFSAPSSYPAKADLVVPSVTKPWSLSSVMKPYVNAVNKYVPGGAIGEDGAGVWIGGGLLQQISKSWGAKVTSAEITRGLLALKGATVGGLSTPLTFPPGNNRQQVDKCITVVKFTGGSNFTAPLGANKFICTP